MAQTISVLGIDIAKLVFHVVRTNRVSICDTLVGS
jgi:hypothetical protein